MIMILITIAIVIKIMIMGIMHGASEANFLLHRTDMMMMMVAVMRMAIIQQTTASAKNIIMMIINIIIKLATRLTSVGGGFASKGTTRVYSDPGQKSGSQTYACNYLIL